MATPPFQQPVLNQSGGPHYAASNTAPFSNQPAAPAVQTPAQTSQAQPREVNPASLYRYGREMVQEIISRATEIFQILKSLQPPNGTTQGSSNSSEKQTKLKHQLENMKLMFKHLRVIYDKSNESGTGMEYTHVESLIPYKDDPDNKLDEKKSTEQYKYVYEESREVIEQVVLKNRHLRDVIELLRSIIWDINTMLAMRRPS